jgi:hypothetical protein
MRYWSFADYTIDANNQMIPEVVTLSESEILIQYWDYWCSRMIAVNKQHLITKENCVTDWVICNMAWETSI